MTTGWPDRHSTASARPCQRRPMPIDDRARARRHALLRAHYAAENDNDVDRIMATFSETGEMLYNRQAFRDPESIRLAHGYIGFSAAGAFSGLRTIADHEHYTADEVVIEGRLC